MRVCVMSDLHLEIERHVLLSQGQVVDPATLGPQLDGIGPVDLVVLAGDIDEGRGGLDYAAKLAKQWECRVVYVLGNHEYYGYSLPVLRAELRAREDADGVYVLDERDIVIDGWRILGCTLWTDYRLYGDVPGAMKAAMQGVEDHRRIGWSQGQPFTPEHATGLFEISRGWLATKLSEGDPERTIVVTHHAPIPQSIPPRFHNGVLSPAFASDLRDVIRKSQPALWIYGHTHYDLDFMIGRTRVVSRQRGYRGIDEVAGFVAKVIDLSQDKEDRRSLDARCT